MNDAAPSTERRADPIEQFYDRHPYPPPVHDPTAPRRFAPDHHAARVAHHLVWPARAPSTVRSVLIAGCGTSQAVRHAIRHPDAAVVGIDVAGSSIDHTRALADQYDVRNLEVQQLAIEDVGELGRTFDLVVCTGVLHHLDEPSVGLGALRGVLAQQGAIRLMVYARFGRFGVEMFQEYCRRLNIEVTPGEIGDLVGTLRELPLGHPLSRLLREARDFADDDALADALLNPRERSYSVPELLELIDTSRLRFGRWEHQAPYLPDCGSLSETPHAARIVARPPAEQYALAELFRGTIVRHTVVVHRDDDATSGVLNFAGPASARWVPVPVPTALVVQERLPPGAAAALLNRAHTDTDLVSFVDDRELELFRAIDGARSIAELGDGSRDFVERLWRHDLVVIDATAAGAAA